MRTMAIASIFLVSCAGASSQDGTPTSTPTTATAAPTATSDTGDDCGPCAAPAHCITVVGMTQGSAHKECWITCGNDADCPKGKKCITMLDGPGQVCK